MSQMNRPPQIPRPDEANVERRADGEQRLVTTLLVGRLIAPGGDGLCRVRNMSAGGARIETPYPLRPGDPVRVELRGDTVLEGHIRWISPGTAGMQFDQTIDTAAVLHGGVSDHEWHHRMPRAPTACSVVARQSGRIVRAEMLDINPRGARLGELRKPFADGLLLLSIPLLDPVEAVVRWRNEDMVGVQFTRSIAFGALAEWLLHPEVRFAHR